MRTVVESWLFWALLSACFAALTAVFAKVGVEDIDSNLATFIRTLVVIAALVAILVGTGKFGGFSTITARSYVFLVLSGLATGASWLAYFHALKLGEASQVAPIDKMSVVLVAIFAVLFLNEKLTLTNWFGIVLTMAGGILVALR